MKHQFLLPDPGEGLLEAEIVAWQRCLVEEQRAFGHEVPAELAGRLREAADSHRCSIGG